MKADFNTIDKYMRNRIKPKERQLRGDIVFIPNTPNTHSNTYFDQLIAPKRLDEIDSFIDKRELED